MEAWRAAFNATVLVAAQSDPVVAPLLRSPDVADHGQLAPGSPASAALLNAVTYMASHVDAVRGALGHINYAPTANRSQLIVDIGAGAGTVGAAAGALLGHAAKPIHYVGLEVDDVLRTLGAILLQSDGVLPPGSTVTMTSDLGMTLATAAERAIEAELSVLTFSYVFRQRSVSALDAVRWASVARSIARRARELRVVVVDANTTSPPSRLPMFIAALAGAGVETKGTWAFSSPLRFPQLEPGLPDKVIPKENNVELTFLRLAPQAE